MFHNALLCIVQATASTCSGRASDVGVVTRSSQMTLGRTC